MERNRKICAWNGPGMELSTGMENGHPLEWMFDWIMALPGWMD